MVYLLTSPYPNLTICSVLIDQGFAGSKYKEAYLPMENEQIKHKIVAETTALMTLKVDNYELVKHTFSTIRNRVEELHSPVPEENEIYTKAFTLIEAAINTEYKQFSESLTHDEKEQALIQLKHKAAEVCDLVRTK